MSPAFRLSVLSRHCLLAITTTSLSTFASAASPWTVTDGTTLTATTDYASRTAGDYPLFVSGENSVLQTQSPLDFRTTGGNLYAANVLNRGMLDLDTATLMTSGQQSHGINVDNATVKVNGGTITVSGSNSAGINADRGALLDLKNLSITADGNSGSGIALKTGTLNASDLNVFNSGTFGRGIDLAYSTDGDAQATLKNVNIVMRGNSEGGLMLGNGVVNGDGVNVSATGTARGVEIYNATTGHGTMTLNDSNISTTDGDAVYLLSGDITLNNATINTGSGIGVNVNQNAQAALRGGSITTQEDEGSALWVASRDSSADISGASFTTYGNSAHAVNVQLGAATLTDTSLNTSGTGSYGLYTEGQVTGSGLSIETEGTSGIGVFSAKNGSLSLEDSSIVTYGDKAAALLAYPGASITANNIKAETQGQNAYALWARSGTLNISNSALETQGDAPGLYVSNDIAMNGSTVVLDNTSLVSQTSTAVLSKGASLDLTVKNGSQLTGGNGTLLSSISDVQPSQITLNADNNVQLTGDIVAENNNRVDTHLTQSSQLTGAVLNGADMTLDGSSRWLMTKNSDLKSLSSQGAIEFVHSDDGFKTLALGDLAGSGSFAMTTNLQALSGDLITVSGYATGEHLLAIKNSGLEPGKTTDVLAVVKTAGTGDEHFSLQNGVVDAGTYQYELKHQNNDWVLTQKFKDEGGDQGGDDGNTGGDQGGDEGNTGGNQGGDEGNTGGNQGGDEGNTGGNQGGDDGNTGGNQGGDDGNTGGNQGGDDGNTGGNQDGDNRGVDPILTPSAVTALGVFNAMPSAWYGELSTLRTRLGDVRLGKQEGGAWVRGVGGQFKMHDANGDGYSQKQSGISVGADSAIDLGQSQMLLGVFSGYSQSNLEFARNSSGTIDSFFIGGYSTFLLQDGWFIDNVVKANNFTSHTDARMSDGTLADGGYSTPALGLSVELGKRIAFNHGWFAEPSAQLSAVWIKGANYRLSNGLEADSNMATSKQGALHMVVGRTLELQNGMTVQPWVRASLIEEFARNNKVNINDNGFNNDMSGLRGEYTLGASAQVTKDLQLYTEVNYSKGEKTEMPWEASLGVRWSW